MKPNQVIKYAFTNALSIYMNFVHVINTCFKKYLVFEGRANRAEYWYWRLFEFLVAYASLRIDQIFFENNSSLFSLFVFFITLMPGISVSVRRLHDIGRSGWWLLAPFLGIFFFFFTKITNMSIIFTNVAIILSTMSFLVLLFWFISPGTKDKNRFG